MQYIINAFKFTFKHPIAVGILLILCSMPYQIIFAYQLLNKTILVILFIPAMLLYVYLRAAGYSVIWKMFSGAQDLTARSFAQEGKKYFGILLRAGIIIGLLSMILLLPGWVRTFMERGNEYKDTMEAFLLTNIPILIISIWTIYILPYIFVFDIRKVSVVRDGCIFLIKHFTISIPTIVFSLLSTVVGIGLYRLIRHSNQVSFQYQLYKGASSVFHFYLSIIVFLSASQILKKYGKRDDEEWVCTECDAVVPADAKICPKCGADVSEIEEDYPDQS